MKRVISAVTTGRADYSIYRPILRRIQADPDLELVLYATGTHLAPGFGYTVRDVERDGLPIAQRVDLGVDADGRDAASGILGRAVLAFGEAFSHRRPDILLLVGDRFEVLGVAMGALVQGIAMAHVHGGEVTEGAFDDAVRHALTKLSHLHFASTRVSADRIAQMGEEPWRITVSGAPALDQLASAVEVDDETLARQVGSLDPAPLVVTFHPVTLELADTEVQVQNLLGALRDAGRPLVFTYPNADPGHQTVLRLVRDFAAQTPNACVVMSLGSDTYYALLRRAAAMVGNSSSGIVEAASFRLPVVNVGTRQQGRLRATNVVDTGYSRSEIAGAIRRVLAPEFRAQLADLENPYGKGNAAETIVETLKRVPLGPTLLRKRFVDR